MSGHDIFVSYSREDRAAARHFAECFEREGLTVWWDAALSAGETFDEVIERELRAAKAVVVLWSPRSVSSRWVRAEATLADRRQKLAPAIIESCDRPIIFELTHAADLANWTGDITDPRWQAFVRDLRHLVQKGIEEEGAPAPVKAAPPVAAARVAPPVADRTPRPAINRAPAPDLRNGSKKVSTDDLMLALASLRSARSGPERDEDLDSEATQFTHSNGMDLYRGDQFHCLEITDGEKLEQRFVVSPLGVKIGRTAPADIILGDPSVSRSHCMVELDGANLRVSDLNSTNGTYIDSVRIAGQALLSVGSLLRVGNVVMRHEIRTRAEV